MLSHVAQEIFGCSVKFHRKSTRGTGENSLEFYIYELCVSGEIDSLLFSFSPELFIEFMRIPSGIIRFRLELPLRLSINFSTNFGFRYIFLQAESKIQIGDGFESQQRKLDLNRLSTVEVA